MSRFKPTDSFRKAPPRAPKPAATQTAVLTAEPSTSQPAATYAEPDLNPLQKFGFAVLALFVFFKFSFFHEFLGVKVGADLHLIILLTVLSAVGAIASGHLAVAFRDKLTWLWVGFAVWMAIATVTSSWRGGSFLETETYWRASLPVIAILPALTRTKKQLMSLLSTIGIAGIVAVALGVADSDFASGRMSIDQVNGEISNSNDYAAYLILMLPAIGYFLFRPGRKMALKIVGGLVFAVSMYEILATGSRGGLVGLGVMVVFVALIGNKRLKAGILIGLPVLALLAIPFVPHESMERLKTLFGSDAPVASEAAASKEQRIELLKESIALTLAHPLTGVGPDQFMDMQAEHAHQEGQRGMWHVTHNSYTQVSSECGIPALILYIAAIVTMFRRFYKLRKHPDKDIALFASTAAMMVIGFAACEFFLSLGYAIQFLVMGAMAVALTNITPAPNPPKS